MKMLFSRIRQGCGCFCENKWLALLILRGPKVEENPSFALRDIGLLNLQKV